MSCTRTLLYSASRDLCGEYVARNILENQRDTVRGQPLDVLHGELFGHRWSNGRYVVSIILSIVFIGCVINDEPVQPNLPQTPIVVVQPSVVVSGKGARLTATLNPNNLATECYFEYGLTTAYGTKLPVKSIHPTAGDVVVGDTISNLVGDSTYHCRLVAWNSSGSTQSVDRAFVAANLQQTPPILIVQPSVVVSGNQAWLKATLNPNNLATECYFEYGLTTAYGTKLQVKSIHPTAGDVVVGDTISFLVRDSTYHCRLVAWNSSGSTESDDRSFMAASGPPVVMAKVTYLGDEGKLIGTVTPNGRKTTCYIEYGPTTAYGSQSPAT